MKGNRGTDTAAELALRHLLRDAGYPGYRLHWTKAPGRPDIAYPGRKIAIDVSPSNNEWISDERPARRAATKWAARYLFWLQNLLELHAVAG